MIDISETECNIPFNNQNNKTMYFIQKLSDSWLLLDIEKNSSRTLDKQEADLLMKMFPSLFENRMLNYVEVSSINPGKLMKMNNRNNSKLPKKTSSTLNINNPSNS